MTHSSLQTIADEVMALPLYRYLGLELISMEPGAAEVRLPISGSSMGLGHFNGGLMPALLDAACFFAVLPMLEDDEECSTTDTSSVLLRPSQIDDVIDVHGEVVQRGRTRAFSRATAAVEGRTIAYGHVTKAITRPEGQRWTA